MPFLQWRVLLLSLFIFLFAASAPPPPAEGQTTVEQRAALQAQLDQIERDIANNQGTLSDLQKRRATLEREISILDKKINIAKLQIKQTDLALKQLQNDISDKRTSITEVDGKVAAEKDSLAQILRRTREIDDTPLSVILLSDASLSDVFREIDDFSSIKTALDDSFERMSDLRSELSARKLELEGKHEEAEQVRKAQVIARERVQQDQKDRQQILKVTKGEEKTYQQIIADKQRKAAAIREALFGLRDSAAIPFGTALDYAKEASRATGVRPAVILAVLTQESDLGKNVGSCYVTDLDTGAGVGKNTGRVFASVMKPSRDIGPFLEITKAVGRDWPTTPVSCPQASGYGGAMGPAQFIPSTWMLFTDRLALRTGGSFPDPWNGRTAIFATALLMADNGADSGTRASERTAALKYFAGSNWRKAANAIYGDSVMDHADRIQGEIDILGG